MKLNELSKRKRTAVLATTFLVIVVLLLLIAELSVRVRSYLQSGFWWGVEDTYIVDDRTGLRIPQPGLTSPTIMINAHGFRSPEISVSNTERAIRIAFLGGSTTYCAEVSSNAMTWPHLVTDQIQAAFPEATFEYINAGVPGYGVAHSQRNLEARVAQFEPDIIVIYHATNDLSFNSFQAAMQAGLAEKRADESLFWLSNYSLLSYLIELNLKVLFLQSDERRAGDTASKLQVDTNQLAAPFERDLRKLVRTSHDHSAAVAIATFSVQYRREQPQSEQTRAASTSLYYMPYMTVSGLLDSFDAYNEAIRDIAGSEDAILIDGENSIPGDDTHFNDSVHFKDAGSVAMARRVATALVNSADVQSIVKSRNNESE